MAPSGRRIIRDRGFRVIEIGVCGGEERVTVAAAVETPSDSGETIECHCQSVIEAVGF